MRNTAAQMPVTGGFCGRRRLWRGENEKNREFLKKIPKNT